MDNFKKSKKCEKQLCDTTTLAIFEPAISHGQPVIKHDGDKATIMVCESVCPDHNVYCEIDMKKCGISRERIEKVVSEATDERDGSSGEVETRVDKLKRLILHGGDSDPETLHAITILKKISQGFLVEGEQGAAVDVRAKRGGSIWP